MKPNQHTAEQIITILDQALTGKQTVASICRDYGIAENTFYRWRKTSSGMAVSDVQRLKELEKENSRLKRLLAERMLENDLLKQVLQKKGCLWPSNARRFCSWLQVACRCAERAPWLRSIGRRSSISRTLPMIRPC